MSDTVYTPQVVMPMLRQVFPSMMQAKVDPNEKYPLEGHIAKQISNWGFLSRRRLKHQIPNVQLNLWCMSINKVICAGEKPTHFTSRAFNLLEEDGRNDFMVELGNLADLHGIIRLKKGVIWVKRATDTKQLNIDPRIMDGLMERIKEQCQVKYNKVDMTKKLTMMLGGGNFTSHMMGWAKNP